MTRALATLAVVLALALALFVQFDPRPAPGVAAGSGVSLDRLPPSAQLDRPAELPAAPDSNARVAADLEAAASASQADRNKTGSERVTVVDERGAPVAGATLEATFKHPRDVAATTGADGSCALERFASGPPSFYVHTYAPGFSHTNAALKSSGNQTIVLFDPIPVRGRCVELVDGGQLGVAGVEVVLSTCCELETASSTAGGSFSFALGPEDAGFTLNARAPGYVEHTRDIAKATPGGSVVLTLTAGEPIEIAVVDFETGLGLEGAVVGHPNGSFTTDPDGLVVTDQLLERDSHLPVYIGASKEGYVRLSAPIDPSELRAGPLVLRLPRSASLVGSIADADGPLGNYSLRLQEVSRLSRRTVDNPAPQFPTPLADVPPNWRYHGARPWFLSADGEGRFRVDGLLPWHALYDLHAGGRSHTSQVTPVETGPPGSTAEVHVLLERQDVAPLTAIEGSVTLNGKPLHASVRWRGEIGEGRIWCSSTGRLSGTAPTGRLEFTATPRRGDRCPELALTRTVEVPAPEAGPLVLDFDLELPMATVSGRVRSTSGAPRRGVAVWLDSEATCLEPRTRTDAEGRFELEVPDDPTVWSVRADGLPRGTARSGERGLELVLPELIDVAYRAVDPSTGRPFEGVSAYIDWSGSGSGDETGDREHYEFENEACDSDGWFHTQLYEGDCVVTMLGEEPPSLSVTREVRIAGPKTQIEFELVPTGELRVSLAEGQEPLPGDVWVLLLHDDLVDRVRFDPVSRNFEYDFEFQSSHGGRGVANWWQVASATREPSSLLLLRPGPHRFVAYPDTIQIDPPAVVIEPKQAALQIRWSKK